MLDRRLLLHFDWVLLLLTLALTGIGLLTLYSAGAHGTVGESKMYLKQLLWLGGALAVLLLTVAVDYQTLGRYAHVFYAGALLLLLAVLFVGRTGLGAQRWLSLGPLSLQPSEIAKVAVILLLARLLSLGPVGDLRLRDLIRPALFVLLPVVMVLKQPDLGSALMILCVSGTLILIAGVRRSTLVALVGGGLVALPPAAYLMWGMLKGYQKNRILAFLDPEIDPLGIGYHLTQSKIAVGSGQILGKGYLSGTQGQLAFLPERHTDFIFAVFAEEWGFIGGAVLLGLYLLLILWGVEIARQAKDRFGCLLASGVVAMLSLYVLVNIGMTVGLLPVVGIPLPLMSYGGSALTATYLAVGLLMNVRMRRFHLFH